MKEIVSSNYFRISINFLFFFEFCFLSGVFLSTSLKAVDK